MTPDVLLLTPPHTCARMTPDVLLALLDLKPLESILTDMALALRVEFSSTDRISATKEYLLGCSVWQARGECVRVGKQGRVYKGSADGQTR